LYILNCPIIVVISVKAGLQKRSVRFDTFCRTNGKMSFLESVILDETRD
jgi:hypothetical protein